MPQFFHLYNSNKNGVGINGLLRELTHMTWYKGADFLSLSQLSLEWGLLGIQCFFFAGGLYSKVSLGVQSQVHGNAVLGVPNFTDSYSTFTMWHNKYRAYY